MIEQTKYKGIAFVHIPKTAGTSFRHQLHDGLGKVYLDYENPLFAKETDLTPKQVMQSGDYRGITGHVQASRYLKDAKENSWALVTFIRDPLLRACSEYAFLVELSWKGLINNKDFFEERPSFIDWLENPRWKSNVYEHALDIDVEKFDFIGRLERYDQSINILNKMFNSNIRSTKENVSSFAYRPSDAEIKKAKELLVKEEKIYLELLSYADRFFN